MKKYLFLGIALLTVSSIGFCVGQKMCEDGVVYSTTKYIVLDQSPENKYLQDYLQSIPCSEIKTIFGKAKKETFFSYIQKQKGKTGQVLINSPEATTVNIIIKAINYLNTLKYGNFYNLEEIDPLYRDTDSFKVLIKEFTSFNEVYSQNKDAELAKVFDFIKLKAYFIYGDKNRFLELSKKLDQNKVVENFVEFDGFIIPLPKYLRTDGKINLKSVSLALEQTNLLKQEIQNQTNIETLYVNRKKYLDFSIPKFSNGLTFWCGLTGIDDSVNSKLLEEIKSEYYKKIQSLFKSANIYDLKYMTDVLHADPLKRYENEYADLSAVLFNHLNSDEPETKQLALQLIEYLDKNLKNEIQIKVFYSDASILTMKEGPNEYWTIENRLGDLLIKPQSGKNDLAKLAIDKSKSQSDSFLKYLTVEEISSNIYFINQNYYFLKLPSLNKKLHLYSEEGKDIPHYLIFSKFNNQLKLEFLYITPPFYDPDDGGPC